jgi:hypothetical protein
VRHYQGVLIAAALVATAAQAQGVLTELRWVDGGAAQGGVLRCDAGQDFQLSLEGEDASMQRVPLAMYAPEVTSSDAAVARAATSTSYAHIVNVRCVRDGEAWLTADTMGKQAHFGVLVGSAKGQAAMGQPRPGIATGQRSYASTDQAVSPSQKVRVPDSLKTAVPIARRAEEPATFTRAERPIRQLTPDELNRMVAPRDPAQPPTEAAVTNPTGPTPTEPVQELSVLESVTIPFVKRAADGFLETPAGILGATTLHYWINNASIAEFKVRLHEFSSVYLAAPQSNLPTGLYKVRFGVTRANAAGSLQLTAHGVQSTCALSAQMSAGGPVQNCEIGPFQTGDNGRLSVSIQSGTTLNNWAIGDITLSRLGTPVE